MEVVGIERFLEKPTWAPFYDLLGGLADNVLTLGDYAGSFLECAACGDTFTLKDESWKCEKCGEAFGLKFKPCSHRESPFETKVTATRRSPSPAGAPSARQSLFETKVTATGLTKPRTSPHWYFDNENWAVAEFLTQVLRLPSDVYLPAWFQELGIELRSDSALESVLCWPRFAFGGKTIQPDLAVGFGGEIVLVEFKRPGGPPAGAPAVPPVELAGQVCFAMEAAKALERQWHIVLVPGPDSRVDKTSSDYARDVVRGASKASEKWRISPATVAHLLSLSAAELASRIHVVGWETLLQKSAAAARASLPESWTRRQALAKLSFFHRRRAELKLFASAEAG